MSTIRPHPTNTTYASSSADIVSESIMSATKTDYQVASLAAGFSLGFGFLTAWEAIKQTRRNRSPLRSSYIYMIVRPTSRP